MKIPKSFDVVAHRGDRAHYPENTLIAMESALKKGCSFIECDVQLNADNCFYLLHDDTFTRTGGTKQSILELTNTQVSTISVHEPKRFSDSFKPTPVPRLEELLKLIQQFPHAKLMVELKQHSIRKWGLHNVMSLLINQLLPFSDQCILISFNAEAVLLAQKTGKLETGWVLKKYDHKTLQKAQQLQPHYLITDKAKVPRNTAAVMAVKEPWVWMLYDINTVTEAQQYAEQGYHLMETDNIEQLMSNKLKEHLHGL